ncbi:hypothetical protein D3C73_558200 [compost metagenome]
MRQVLAAKGFRRGQPVPAAIAPAAVKIGPALRRRHLAVFEFCTLTVALLAERRDLARGEASGFLKDCRHQITAEVAEAPLLQGRGKTGNMVQREGNLLHRGAVHMILLISRAALPLRTSNSFYVNVKEVVNRQVVPS